MHACSEVSTIYCYWNTIIHTGTRVSFISSIASASETFQKVNTPTTMFTWVGFANIEVYNMHIHCLLHVEQVYMYAHRDKHTYIYIYIYIGGKAQYICIYIYMYMYIHTYCALPPGSPTKGKYLLEKSRKIVNKRTRRLLEVYHLAEDNAREADLEAAS